MSTPAIQSRITLTKAEVLKLNRGTIVQLCWNDGPDTRAILLDKPERSTGDVQLSIFDETLGFTRYHATHQQVVAVLGSVPWPKMVEPS